MYQFHIISILLGGLGALFSLSRAPAAATTTSQALTLIIFSLPLAQAAYVLKDDYSGDAFFQNFEFFTDADPTNGHVKFQSMKQANASGLVGFMDGGNATKAVYMGVDTTSQAPQGRGSVRVQSQKNYQHALVIADIVHMPGGVCGTWPAFWMVGSDWPVNGEIDIIEGVNDQNSNQMTLHTDAGVVISKQASNSLAAGASKSAKAFTGSVLTANCDVNAPGQDKNAGCAIADDSGLTFGADFNANGGGVVAMEWTSEAIKIWMFARGSFPNDIASAQPNPSANWGPPTSLFTGNFSMDNHFKNLNIVFDTTFCGDWAGNTWNTPGSKCAALAPTCEQYVSNSPKAFNEAYWAINTLQVFQDDSDGSQKGVSAQGQKQVSAAVNVGVDTGAGLSIEKAKGRFIKSANLLTRAPQSAVDENVQAEQTTDTDANAAPETVMRRSRSKRWVRVQEQEQEEQIQSDRALQKRTMRRRSGGAVIPLA